MKGNKLKKLWGIPLFILIFAALVGATMLLWNALLPAIFGVVAITYWQALGLLVLGRLLFGGFGKMGHGMRHFGHRHHGRHGWHGRGGDGRFGGRGRDERFSGEDFEMFMGESNDPSGRGASYPLHKLRERMKSMTRDERREFFHNRLHNQHILWEEMLDDFDNSDKTPNTDGQR